MRLWKRKRQPFDRLLRETVKALEKGGRRLPEDRNEALSAVSQTIANLVQLVGNFEGRPFDEVPTTPDEWLRIGRTAVELVDGRRR